MINFFLVIRDVGGKLVIVKDLEIANRFIYFLRGRKTRYSSDNDLYHDINLVPNCKTFKLFLGIELKIGNLLSFCSFIMTCLVIESNNKWVALNITDCG